MRLSYYKSLHMLVESLLTAAQPLRKNWHLKRLAMHLIRAVQSIVWFEELSRYTCHAKWC